MLKIISVLMCIALTALILSQEGKESGLGAIDNSSSYWAANKGRSKEGIIVKITGILVALFLIIALVLTVLG